MQVFHSHGNILATWGEANVKKCTKSVAIFLCHELFAQMGPNEASDGLALVSPMQFICPRVKHMFCSKKVATVSVEKLKHWRVLGTL